ncbi:14175_t:CDS:2 [Dentiscutata erythropus]|uniref:14175_t:CDS:1 n=1 Tax=Dentiscutata erythropus TaxID=1348616 RepID=A0A9N9JW68_9GLOM|nr:14175_t:CDS:2 [Dentiscutata erythropus]
MPRKSQHACVREDCIKCLQRKRRVTDCKIALRKHRKRTDLFRPRSERNREKIQVGSGDDEMGEREIGRKDSA